MCYCGTNTIKAILHRDSFIHGINDSLPIYWPMSLWQCTNGKRGLSICFLCLSVCLSVYMTWCMKLFTNLCQVRPKVECKEKTLFCHFCTLILCKNTIVILIIQNIHSIPYFGRLLCSHLCD